LPHSRILTKFQNKVSLALLNPPFSHRGGTKIDVEIGGGTIACSPSSAFVLTAFKYLNANGELAAILPAGTLSSEKDERAWNFIRSVAFVSHIGNNGNRIFKGCAAHTVLVHIVRRARSSQNSGLVESSDRGKFPQREALELFRGKIPMHTVQKDGPKLLIHTTGIRNGKVNPIKFRSAAGHNVGISGPLVLVPRVGRPSFSKLVLFRATSEFVLSDCVYALRCQTFAAAKRLHKNLAASWEDLRVRYVGTGAPYLTVRRLCDFLEERGYFVKPLTGIRHSSQFLRAMGVSLERKRRPNPS